MISVFSIAKGNLDSDIKFPISEKKILKKWGHLAEYDSIGSGIKEITIEEKTYVFEGNKCIRVKIWARQNEETRMFMSVTMSDFIEFCMNEYIKYKLYFDNNISKCISINGNTLFWFEEDDYKEDNQELTLSLIEIFSSPPVPASCL